MPKILAIDDREGNLIVLTSILNDLLPLSTANTHSPVKHSIELVSF